MKSLSRGFTIVEIMIVVAILSIISMLAIPAYQGYIETARRATAQANIEPLRIALEDFRLDNPATGYANTDGTNRNETWDPAGVKTLETGSLGWKPDGDKDAYVYNLAATAATYTITVTPIGHAADVQTFTK